jgi:ACS family hexuronate transporter-like MFS transporter
LKKIPHLRWWIVGLLFLASVLNYLDRQTLSILAPTIQSELQISDQDYAFVVNLFLIAYTTATLLSGFLVDRLGVRWALALFVGWWSIANILTGFARSLTTLGLFRFMLGMGEAGNWTAAPKAVSDWFPPKERGLAVSLYTVGATIGATVAPLLIVTVATVHGWQMAFVATGIAGLVWLIPWLLLYHRPNEHSRLSGAEREYIAESSHENSSPPAPVVEPEGWRTVISRRDVWLLTLARLLTDPLWYFYQFWFAKYLYDERGVSQAGLSITFVIFLAADFGAIAGGWFSGRLINAQRPAAHSRAWAMAAAACAMPLSMLIPQLGTGALLAIGMIVAFAHMAWLINLSALVVDLIPRRSLATTFGVIATGSAVGGMVMNWAVGRLITEYSYSPAFFAMAVVHPVALLLVWPASRARAVASRRDFIS